MELTPQETSVLSFIATTDHVPKNQLNRLMNELSPDAKEIAKAILEMKGQKRHRMRSSFARFSADAQESARALLGQI